MDRRATVGIKKGWLLFHVWATVGIKKGWPMGPPFRRRRTASVLLSASFGGDKESRTPDLFIANEALYQLSYIPKSGA